MNALVLTPFRFDNHDLRVQLDDAGQPWFNANDVCASLELANSRDALAKHVDSDDVAKRDIIDSLGRIQLASFVNQSGLYALIIGSTKDAAKRFKRWVTSEVLPSIQKTGSYTAPGLAALPAHTQDRIAGLLLIGEAVAKVPGVKAGIAMAATLTCIQENTGLSMEMLRRTLPAANEPICSHNATQLGKMTESSAKDVNQALSLLGFQFRNERDEWELSDAGKAWGEALPYSRNGHSGYQILWNPAVVQRLKATA